MKKVILGALFTLLSSGYFFVTAKPDGLLHVSFLNVGQGDSIFIRTPAGENILIDGGPKNRVLKELKEVLPYFDSTFDYVFLTHPDRDHIEGLLAVLKRYPVKRVVFPGIIKRDYFSKKFLQILREKNIPFELAKSNRDYLLSDGVLIDILYPFESQFEIREKTNSFSLVAMLKFGKHRILFAGDADALAEEALLVAAPKTLDADILKVGHHGSRSSTSESFLSAVTPETSVISVGKSNEYHHPHPSVIKKLRAIGSKIYRTDLEGRIEFVFSQTRVISAPKPRNFSSNWGKPTVFPCNAFRRCARRTGRTASPFPFFASKWGPRDPLLRSVGFFS